MARKSAEITEEQIRERAYRLWVEEGQPQGRASEHWEKARQLLALEANPEEGREDPEEGYNEAGPWGEPVEQAALLANQGEFPTTTDQGEQDPPGRQEPAAKRSSGSARKRSA